MKKLRVGLNARVLNTKQLRGWSRYTLELFKGLKRQGADVILFSDKPLSVDLLGDSQVPLMVREGNSYIDWEQRVLLRMAQEAQVDVLHCPVNYGLPYLGSIKKVLTLHDAIDKAFSAARKSVVQKLKPVELKIQLYQWLSQRAADHVITVSEHAKTDLIRYFGLPPEKISVIYESADDHFDVSFVKPLPILQKKYPQLKPGCFFYVGGLEERKNIDGLLKAYALSRQERPLLIAGGNAQARQSLQALCVRLNLEQRVLWMDYILDEDLPSVYHYSHCFIYPSFYEGFGLQAVEAMKMKKAVLVAETTSLREVVGIPECLFNPSDLKQMAQKIDEFSSPVVCEAFSALSYERSKFFSWDQCVRRTIEVYQKVLNR